MHSLNDKALKVSREIERVHIGETRLLKQRRTGEYLALEKGDVDVLRLFDGEKTVNEIFHTMLVSGERPKIREFYDLVFDAVEKGFLYDGADEPVEPSFRGQDWRILSNPLAAVMLPLLLIVGGVSAAYLSDLALIPEPAEWFLVLLYVSIGLSIGTLMSAAALRAYERQIYRPGVRMEWMLPYFSIDTRDAFMGGRACEQVVALNMLAAPGLLAVLGCTLGSVPMYLASLITILAVSVPFGRSAAHQLLHALCRKGHVVPSNANTFIQNNLLSQIFNWRKELKEEHYFIVHSTYTILWLGGVFRFSSELLRDQTELIFTDPKGVVPLVMIGVAVIFPLFYFIWLATRNMWRVAAPRLSAVEAGVKATAKDSWKPEEEELVSFLEGIVLFAEMSREELKKIAAAMSFIPVRKDTLVIREHDRGDMFFAVYKGSVEVLKEDEAGESVPVAKLGKGDVFGEIALLEQRPRTSSIRTVTNCNLLALNRKDFEHLLVDNLGAKKIKHLVQVCAFLRRNPLFNDWPSQALIKIANEFTFTDCPAGSEVIAEGHQNEFFYLIYEGEFDVSREGKSLAKLGPGDFCGEISLLRGAPANAKVTAAANSRALKLDKESFMELVSRDFVMALALDREADRRDDVTEGLQ
jgi:CRP-like cAMP-binding protein